MFKENQDFHLNGLPLEQQTAHWLDYKMHLSIDHNDFDLKKYPSDNHNIVDIIVANKIAVEITNPKDSTEMNDKIMLNKLDYFKRKDPAHLLIWVLIVSFANFSEYILNQIKELNIHLIELKIHADQNSKFNVVKQLFKSRLYSLIKQVFNPKAKSEQFLCNNQLSKYSNTVLSANTLTVNKTSDIKHNNLHQHNVNTKIKQDNSEILDKWEISKDIERAKRLGLFDNYGFSN